MYMHGSLRRLLARKQGLQAQLPQTPAQLKQLDGAWIEYKELLIKFSAGKAWTGVETEVVRVGEEMWQASEQAARIMLSRLQRLHAIGVVYNDVMGRRALVAIPGFSSFCAGLCSIYCLVTLVFLGWLSVALRCFGFPAYTQQMRARLGTITIELYALVLSFVFSYSLRQHPAAAAVPPAAIAVAAIVATMPLIRAVGGAKELWYKDEVLQRQQDDKKLAKCLNKARGTAAAAPEGSLANLARAMADMLQRAQRTRQPAAQQPANQQQAGQQPANQQQAGQQPANQQQAGQQPANQQQAGQQPANQQQQV